MRKFRGENCSNIREYVGETKVSCFGDQWLRNQIASSTRLYSLLDEAIWDLCKEVAYIRVVRVVHVAFIQSNNSVWTKEHAIPRDETFVTKAFLEYLRIIPPMKTPCMPLTCAGRHAVQVAV